MLSKQPMGEVVVNGVVKQPANQCCHVKLLLWFSLNNSHLMQTTSS